MDCVEVDALLASMCGAAGPIDADLQRVRRRPNARTEEEARRRMKEAGLTDERLFEVRLRKRHDGHRPPSVFFPPFAIVLPGC